MQQNQFGWNGKAKTRVQMRCNADVGPIFNLWAENGLYTFSFRI